ncbi:MULTISPECIES: CinA family protein [Rhodococcus]|jgi:nicotinamide-nucleotide amidase|uniref:CinA family protein n=1 Tax=Rhodococcus oxybenzonivorans TaxID=1990687 RepID=A0AAE4UYN2_9NOCA|nr:MULTISPECIES: CinA family protein [Rhodococcus]MDV7243787.1 CinA family protein [Rhodococcus oxybenzonivorans]MDV7265376.1 CinA family protein [Rhodococcus oxybenzonivorans]MDV7274971.1 CinA family protein [Rhodococcus oxybenzonivorans]MDV7335210.1 CinA family protein [Rhodococcus oxybenzonivorans]MDV7345920.1 CinA family protein [Rhodococcus oxybenzonivorans]
MGSNETTAERIADAAGRAQVSVATAESLTGGQISCVLGAAPSSSDWYKGSIVAYSSEVKHRVLKVPEGPVVSEASARAMVAAVAEILDADVAVAVTGAGGPDPQDGQPPGTVWFGVIAGGEVSAELQHFDGDPKDVVDATTEHALSLLAKTLDGLSD